MFIDSKSSVTALSLQILLWSFFLALIFHDGGFLEGPYILIPALGVFLVLGNLIKLGLNLSFSPKWLKLEGNKLVVKLRMRDSFVVDVSEVTRIAEAKWIRSIASYNRKLICDARGLTLYLGTVEFVGLEDFLTELKKLNPACKVDEWIQ